MLNPKEWQTYLDKEVKMNNNDKKLRHLQSLIKKHRAIDEQVQKEYSMHVDVQELKKQKLHMKEEIKRLESELKEDGFLL